jgi:5-methyltetrahydrofolate--homocysteine methyltransferase
MAIIAHHPQAVYFAMKSGFLPKGAPPPDEVIRGSERDPTRGIAPGEAASEEPLTQRREEAVAEEAVAAGPDR